jgi:pseudouridylate synthase
MRLRVHPEVYAALEAKKPVVALESTVITHGLPRPKNLELALALEAVVRNAGATPATIGILQGDLVIGLTTQQMDFLANTHVYKASLWNLPTLMAQEKSAGTTVSVTLHAAALAGIEVFATGGIGGVHHEPFDESADLPALAKYPVITVCAGPKSILNVKGTIERLESYGVPVLGYRSDCLAGFHLSQTPYQLPARVESPEEIAKSFIAQRQLKLRSESQLLESWLVEAHTLASQQQTQGKDVTPFLLAALADISQGQTVEVNVRLLKENTELATLIALALSKMRLAETKAGA